jgi:hypothetical protein
MSTFDGSAERRPEILSVVARKRAKQIVKRVHHRSRCRILVSARIPAGEFAAEYALNWISPQLQSVDPVRQKNDFSDMPNLSRMRQLGLPNHR